MRERIKIDEHAAMEVLHVAPIGNAPYTGLHYSIPSLVEAQYILGVSVSICSTIKGQSYTREVSFPISRFSETTRKNWFRSRYHKGNKVNLIVFHSTYLLAHLCLAKSAVKEKIPYIICPRGGFSREAMKTRKWRKFFVNKLAFNRFVQKASAIHFLTEQEARDSYFGVKNYFILPNGVQLPQRNLSIVGDLKESNRPLRIGFLGRFDIEQKGLDLLLQAAAILERKQQHHQLALEVAGYGTQSQLRTLKDLKRKLSLSNWFRITEPIYGKQKEQFFGRLDYFILPSRHEGHPMAVLEALSYGVPCIVTKGTNFSKEILQANAGYLVDLSAESISQLFLTLLPQRSERVKLRKNARNLAEEYSWHQIAAMTIRQYGKLTESLDA